jgi:hypothetical protein
MAISGMAIAGAPAAAAPPAADKPVEVMVLGTYHFDNPGRDLNNVKADDVLQPKRQREIEALADALAGFRPTKVMVEHVSKTPNLVDAGFTAFTPAMLGEKRGEVEQIGYRLAHRLGHKRVYAIDEQPGEGEPDYFPFGKVMAYAKAHGGEGRLQAAMAKAAAATGETEAKQKRMSIAALLGDYNDPASFLSGISPYYEMLRIGDADAQPGAELNAMWYLRNAKIFAKLMKVAEPGDRILVVFGAGHGYWLRHFAAETPGYRNVDVRPYLARAAGE